MRASDSPKSKDQDRSAVRRLLVTTGVLAFTAAVGGVALFPLILGRMFTSDDDYSRISDIGQSYGAASAMVSTVALGVVLVGLVMQYRQFTSGRHEALSAMTDELVRLAMDEPAYRQCWGARIAPTDVDEALFYYCNRVIKSWKIAWELRDLSEAQARGYLANFFDSEIPRLFWKEHGNWHMQAKARNRREQFLALIEEEYLRAIRGGDPSRPRELSPPAGIAARARRRRLLDADQDNTHPTVP